MSKITIIPAKAREARKLLNANKNLKKTIKWVSKSAFTFDDYISAPDYYEFIGPLKAAGIQYEVQAPANKPFQLVTPKGTTIIN